MMLKHQMGVKVTCSTMTWDRSFLRFAMKPTCTKDDIF